MVWRDGDVALGGDDVALRDDRVGERGGEESHRGDTELTLDVSERTEGERCWSRTGGEEYIEFGEERFIEEGDDAEAA